MMEHETAAEQQNGGNGSHFTEMLAAWKNKVGSKERKLLGKLGLCLVAGVCLMVLGQGLPAGGKADAAPAAAEISAAAPEDVSAARDTLEQRLESILSSVRGAGRVQVAVQYSESASTVYLMESETQQSHSIDGESQSQSAEETLTVGMVGETPVRVKEQLPKIQGVVVVAEGAADAVVKERLFQAVKSLLGIEAGQIAILEGEVHTYEEMVP